MRESWLRSFCLWMAISQTNIRLFGTSINKIILLEENSQYICILVCNSFTAKWNQSRHWSRWENLEYFQCQFQPTKFANSVVPSPWETHPQNNMFYFFSMCEQAEYNISCNLNGSWSRLVFFFFWQQQQHWVTRSLALGPPSQWMT